MGAGHRLRSRDLTDYRLRASDPPVSNTLIPYTLHPLPYFTNSSDFPTISQIELYHLKAIRMAKRSRQAPEPFGYTGQPPKARRGSPNRDASNPSGSYPAGPEAEGDRSVRRRQDRSFRAKYRAAPLKLFVVVLRERTPKVSAPAKARPR